MKTQIYKKQVVNIETGELQIEEIEIKIPRVRNQFVAMQIPAEGEKNEDLSLFVPNQALDLSEILSRSARGMSIPIVTREGVYISKSIDDEIDVLEKMDKDLTDYSKALLRYRREQEERYAKSQEIQRKKDELYNDWVKTLDIKKDKSNEKE